MKKIKVLVLITVFAFAALGGAYAMWADQLVVKETVKTGYLNVLFTDLQNPDPGPNYTGYDGDVYGVTADKEGLDEMDNGNPNNAKNIAAMEASITDQRRGDKGAYNNEDDVLNIKLNNGYPGYQERIFTTITNNGTVPAKFDINGLEAIAYKDALIVEIWFDADPTKAKDNGEDFMIWSNQTGTITPQCKPDPVPPTKPVLEGYQIDPGESIPVAIYTRVKQAANQKDCYNFSIKLNAQQWNEYNFELSDELQTLNRKDPHFGGGSNVVEPKFSDFNK